MTEETGERRDRCALCGSVQQRQVLEGRDQRFGTPGVFSVPRCEVCGLMFQHTMPTREEMKGFCEVPRSGHTHSRLFDGYASVVNASRARFLCAHRPPRRLPYPVCHFATCGYLAATLLGARSEVVRIVAVKSPGDREVA